MAVIAPTKKLLVSLDNGQALYIYNTDLQADLPSAIVLSSQPIVRTQSDGTEVYKFNHPTSGWFGSIKVSDEARCDNILQLPNEDIVIKVTPFTTYGVKDLTKATKFVGGAK